MATTIGDAISRVRNSLKGVKEDPFLTDRFLYSLIMKYAKTFMFRDSKLLNLFKDSSVFKEIPCVELIEVDKVEACCASIKTSCSFMRSKNPIPKISVINGSYVIRGVTTLDYSQKLHQTQPSVYANMARSTSFKYNPHKYFWIANDYLFVPDVTWEGVRIQAMFEDDISEWQCSVTDKTICTLKQDESLNIPEHLFTEIEQMIRQELLMTMQIPAEGADDNQSLLR